VKDAIPISVVNISAASLARAPLLSERPARLLAIQRLSRQPELFVLEREQTRRLSQEKEFGLDETAFWNGSYLLDGSIVQNGVSEKTITLSIRLTPPKSPPKGYASDKAALVISSSSLVMLDWRSLL